MSRWVAALAVMVLIAASGRPRPAQRLRLLAVEPAVHRVMSSAPAAVVSLVGTLLLVVHVPPQVVAVGAAIGVAAVTVRRRARAARLRDDRSAATVEVTFALAGELRAGRTPAEALAGVGPVAGPLRPAFDAAHAAVVMGGDPAAEIAGAASLPGAERLRYVAAAWAVAASTGGRVAVVLEGLSEAMDDDDELRRELDAAMAGPRATMVMLGALPLLGIALGQAVGARPLQFLVHQPLGWGLLAAAMLLDLIGVLLTRAIARAALRP